MTIANATLSYGGVKLPVWNSSAAGWAGRQIPLSEYMPLEDATGYAYDLWHLHLKTPFPQPDTEIGTLRWPTGASRWAVGHFVVTAAKLDAIRLLVGASNAPQDLVMTDQVTGNTLTTSLYMLPPRPLLVGTRLPTSTETERQATADGALWVMTLVDERFYWWQKMLTIDPVPASWTALVEEVADALGVTIPTPTVPAAWGSPTDRYLVNNAPACLILDSAAEAVGLKFVRGTDGTYLLQSWNAAKTASEGFYAAYTAAVTTGDFIGRGRVRGGGRLASGDIARTAAGRVRIVFGRNVSGSIAAGQYEITKTLSGYTHDAGDLVLSAEYGFQASGMLGHTARFTADAYAEFASGGDVPSNLSTLTGLAHQAAYDWYGWQLPDIDVNLAGIIPWGKDAYADQVKWTYDEDRVETRVRRKPYFDANVYGSHGVVAAAGDGGDDASILVVLSDWDTSGTFVKYSAVEVEASGSVTYAVRSGGRTFSHASDPLYSERNLRVPPTGESAPGVPNFIHEWSVVRARQGPDGFWYFGDEPVIELFRRTGVNGTIGEVAYVRQNDDPDPGPPTWVDGVEVELIEAE